MSETEQFNIRISKSLLDDLDVISKITKIPKSDWVRYNVSELVRKTKDQLLQETEKSFITGRIRAEEFESLTNQKSSAELQAKKSAYQKRMTDIVKDEAHREFARKALLK